MIKDVLSSIEQLKLIKGIEGNLLKRRRRGLILTSVTILIGIAKVISEITSQNEAVQVYFSRVTDYTWNAFQFFLLYADYLFAGGINPAANYSIAYDVLGIYLIILGILIYYLNRYTSLLFKETEDPFQYTFWIDRFVRTEDREENKDITCNDDIHNMLNQDLMDMINKRIGRFSLLDEKYLSANNSGSDEITVSTPPSHIHIDGHYSVRERYYEGEFQKFVQVIPRVRIGPPGNPSILTNPVEIQINKNAGAFENTNESRVQSNSADNSDSGKDEKESTENSKLIRMNYKTVLEQVYSRVSSEIYKQIRNDLNKKIQLFPTGYLQSVALYYEAEDFARSNTVDAFDLAIDLYRQAMEYFKISKTQWLTHLITSLPVVWRFKVKSIRMQAMVQIGYSKCLLYRRQISALSGRKKNPLFGSKARLAEEIKVLLNLYYRIGKNRKIKSYKQNSRFYSLMSHLTFPRDSWFRHKMQMLRLVSSKTQFEKQKQILFNAYIVYGLTNCFLDSAREALKALNSAKAVAPRLSERHALYLLCAGLIEPDLNKSTRLFRQAAENAPDFQIAQYLLAYFSERLFRRENDIVRERARSVINKYDEVLEINPGNVAALASQGYILWLIKDYRESERKFKEGIGIKAFVRETFVGQLNYGLARVAAAEGRLNKGYDLYMQAISSDPGIGTAISNVVQGENSYYDYITPDILKCYCDFKNQVEKYCINKNKNCFIDLKYQNELNKEEISGDLMTLLHSHNIMLTGRNKVSVSTLSKEWRVDDEDRQLSILKIDGRLKINVKYDERIRNAVYSFALNDYGNACLNYFWRYGDFTYLEKSIEAYESALKKYPENTVAKYNLSKAYDFKTEPGYMDKTLEKLEEVVVNYPSWQEGVGLFIQAKIKKIKELSSSIDQIDVINEKIKNILNEPDEYSGITDKNSRELVKQNELKKLNHELKKLGEKNIIERNINEIISDALGRILVNTKLSSLFEGLEINYKGRGVDELLNRKFRIDWERLDENDILALEAWADVLSVCGKEGMYKSVKMCKHLLEIYYPEDFKINLIILDVLRRLPQGKYEDSEFLFGDRIKKIAMTDADALNGSGIVHPEFLRVFRRNGYALSENIEIVKSDLKDFYELSDKNTDDYFMIRPVNGNILNFIYSPLKIINRRLEQNKKNISGKKNKGETGEKTHSDYLTVEVYRKESDKHKEFIRHSINNWLEQDPIHYNTFLWHQDFFSFYENLIKAKRAIKIENSENYSRTIADTYNERTGNRYFDNGDYRNAIKRYESAIECYPKSILYRMNLAGAWEKLREPGRRIEAIDKAVESLNNVIEIEPGMKKEIELKISRLKNTKKFIEAFGENELNKMNIVTPIEVEVASDLIPLISGAKEGSLSDSLSKCVSEMRERILNNYGIRIPGIRFRGNESDLPNGTYVIYLSEIPLSSGNISAEKKLYPGKAEDLVKLNIKGEEIKNSLFGVEGCWILKNNWPLLENSGYKLWEIMEPTIRHLEKVMIKNLTEFTGLQDTINLLITDYYGDYANLKESHEKLELFAAACRELTDEEVPIKSLKLLIGIFNERYSKTIDPSDIAEDFRSLPEIKPGLAGNNENSLIFTAGKRFEEEIIRSLNKNNSFTVLAMEPERCQYILNLVKQKLGNNKNCAILVNNRTIRRYLRKLIELEFPGVPVLAGGELIPEIQYNFSGEIELEEKIPLSEYNFSELNSSADDLNSKEETGNLRTLPENTGKNIAIKVFTNNEFNFKNKLDKDPLEETFKLMKDGLFYELGIILPDVLLDTDNKLNPDEFRFEINEINTGSHKGLQADEFFVNSSADKLKVLKITGKEKINPANSNINCIIQNKTDEIDRCRHAGFGTWGPGEYLVLQLSSVIRKNASDFLTVYVMQQMIESLKTAFPDLVDFILRRYSLQKLQLILRNLLEEEVSIRDLKRIFESLISIRGTTGIDFGKFIVFTPEKDGICPALGVKDSGSLDIDDYENYIRMSMKRVITNKFSKGNNTVSVILLSPETEELVKHIYGNRKSEKDLLKLTDAVAKEFEKLSGTAQTGIVLTALEVRKKFRSIIHAKFPRLAVVSYQELSPDININPVARITV